jgi:membrane fusion protein (multidrug efflux system)
VLVVGADGKVVRKPVTADAQQGGDFVVTSGLADGDKVIVSGVQRVQAGAPAKAVPWKPAAAPASSPASSAH